MRFLANMGISMHTMLWLREHGHDAIHLREAGLSRAADEAVLEKARIEKRVVLTMDLDFGYLLSISQARLPSVVLFRLEDESSEMVNERLKSVLVQCGDDWEAGAIISVNEETIRVRRLPIAGEPID